MESKAYIFSLNVSNQFFRIFIGKIKIILVKTVISVKFHFDLLMFCYSTKGNYYLRTNGKPPFGKGDDGG